MLDLINAWCPGGASVCINNSILFTAPSMMDNSVFLSKECESEMFIRGGIPRKQMEKYEGSGQGGQTQVKSSH